MNVLICIARCCIGLHNNSKQKIIVRQLNDLISKPHSLLPFQHLLRLPFRNLCRSTDHRPSTLCPIMHQHDTCAQGIDGTSLSGVKADLCMQLGSRHRAIRARARRTRNYASMTSDPSSLELSTSLPIQDASDWCVAERILRQLECYEARGPRHDV